MGYPFVTGFVKTNTRPKVEREDGPCQALDGGLGATEGDGLGGVPSVLLTIVQ